MPRVFMYFSVNKFYFFHGIFHFKEWDMQKLLRTSACIIIWVTSKSVYQTNWIVCISALLYLSVWE